MILKNKILALATLVLAAGCVEENLEAPAENPGNGETCISFRTSAPDLVMTKASEGDSRIENALIFVFNDQNVCVAKQWSYIGEDNKMYMYLPSGNINIYAVCNLLDPETVMNRVSDLDDLKNEALTISDWSEAYRGKYVMSGSLQSASKPADDGFLTINVQRVAAQFNVNISFSPVTFPDTEQFEISEVKIHYVPKGTWILPREDGDRPGLEKRDGIGDDIEESGNFSLEKSGCRNDWTYVEAAGDMAQKYFDSAVLTLEEAEAQTAEKWRYSTSFSIFENRRGILNKELSAGAASDPYAVNWPTLYQRDDDERAQYAQLWKKGLHDNVCAAGHEKNAGMEYATYLTISGVYIMSEDLKWETEYYIYLGSDNFSSFDVNRNYQYNMDIVIHTVDNADTRVDPEQIDGMRVYYNEETVLDAHCNSVKTLLYSSGGWEVWVKNPDETPWLELSTASDYKPLFLGSQNSSANAGFKVSGEQGMHYIYVHTDEFVPDLGSPEKNNSVQPRTGTICYRPEGSASDPTELKVTQYPAQMVVLYIEHDVNNLMREVRDTFYVERVLEKKHLEWGFTTYWSLDIDKLIAKGQWDGLNNTRVIYDHVLNTDGQYDKPAYADAPADVMGENRIPNNVALRNVLDKNRDRNGNGYVDRDEIMWFIPGINEMEALYDAKEQLLVEFEGDDDYFFSSTPSSSDPNGITTGYAYYIKMGNGKTGLAQRNSEYNVIACRRTNAWRGAETAAGTGTVTKDEVWEEEDVIMPKN